MMNKNYSKLSMKKEFENQISQNTTPAISIKLAC